MKHGRSADINAAAIPLTDGEAKDRVAESKQSGVRIERNMMQGSAEIVGFCTALWYYLRMKYEKKNAASTPEMVTISQMKCDFRQVQLAELADRKLLDQ